MRHILHVDMNAYFASVEQAANPFLRGKPVAVGGGTGGKRSIVAACSYEAKAQGVKTAMPAWEAKKICPNLTIMAGDMSKYIYTSAQIMARLRHYSPQVEVFSIDEAFVDVTDTQERFGGPIAIAKEIKSWIRGHFRLTCSIGISFNKLLAKLAGELKKPDGLTIIAPEDVPQKLARIPVAKLCGVGRKLEEELAILGIKTFSDLNRYPREKLVKYFGAVWGEQLWQMGRGQDNSAVLPSSFEENAKSMGHSYTLPKATSDPEKVNGYLLRLAEQVGRRLRQAYYRGNVVHLSFGFENFTFWGKQKKIEDYIDDGYKIYQTAKCLLNHLPPTSDHSSCPTNRPITAIRFVGVSLSNLIHNLDQLSLLPENENNKRLLISIDKVNDRWGEFTIERAAIMRTKIEHKSGYVPPRSFRGN